MKWFSLVTTGMLTVALLVCSTGCPSREKKQRQREL